MEGTNEDSPDDYDDLAERAQHDIDRAEVLGERAMDDMKNDEE